MGFLDDILGKNALSKSVGSHSEDLGKLLDGVAGFLPGSISRSVVKSISENISGTSSLNRDEIRKILRDMVREELTLQLEPVMPLLRKLAEEPVSTPSADPHTSSSAEPIPQDGPFSDLADLVEKVRPSVLTVMADEGQGSAVFISPDGLLVTNRHVVGFSRIVTLRLADSSEYSGTVIRSWPSFDLALIRMSDPANIPYIPELELKVREGESVVAMGSPSGLSNTVTQGIVSSIQRMIGKRKYIQHSAAINPGNSGGPLFNMHGRLIGINTLGHIETQGIFMAVPCSVLQQLMQDEDLSSPSNYCSVCGNSSPKEEVFCLTCGYRVLLKEEANRQKNSTPAADSAPPLKCSACGHEHQSYVRFCQHCGENMNRQYEENE